MWLLVASLPAIKENIDVEVTRPRVSLYPHSRNAAHAVEVPLGARLIFTNGQTGTKPDGSTPESTEDQTVVVFERLRTILQAANMTLRDVVRLNTYLTDEGDTQIFLDLRDRIASWAIASQRRRSSSSRRWLGRN